MQNYYYFYFLAGDQTHHHTFTVTSLGCVAFIALSTRL